MMMGGSNGQMPPFDNHLNTEPRIGAESKIGRQGSQFRATPAANVGGLSEYGSDCVNSSMVAANPPKKAGTKSSKKRTLKKNKTNEQNPFNHNNHTSASKSLHRQTTFEMQSMNGYMIAGTAKDH